MNKKNWMTGFLTAACFTVAASVTVQAQNSVPMASTVTVEKPAAKETPKGAGQQSKNSKAQKRYDEGQAAEQKNDYKTAAAAYKKAIEADPDFVAAHASFIRSSIYIKFLEEDSKLPLPGQGGKTKGAFGLKSRANPLGGGPATSELSEFYQKLLGKYPERAAVSWASGYVIMGKDKTQAERYYRKALALDPKFAPAYKGLSTIAVLNKDEKGYGDYLRQAYEADPNNPELALDYAQSLKNAGERSAYHQALENIVSQFPQDKQARYALYDLAVEAESETEKMNYLERMWHGFPNEDDIGFDFMMKDLFGLYMHHSPEKALPLAEAMSKIFTLDKDWPVMIAHQKGMTQARSLLAEKKYAEASAILKKTPNPWGVDLTPYYLVRAEADGAGDAQKSYESLMTAAAKEPNDALNKALMHYGEKTGKTKDQIKGDLWQKRVSLSTPLKEFQLVRHDNEQPVNLADYHGKVVLVSFWFPGCGPCIAEFPYFQQALKKYGPQGFEVLLINILPKEDAQALPVLKDSKVTFVSLKVPAEKWAQKEYNVTGTPVNYLLDENGRIMFRPRVDNPAGQRVFETEIEMLLSHRSSNTANANK